MLVGIFSPATPEMHVDALEAVAQGCQAWSIDYAIFPLEEGYQPCDIAVTFGVGKQRTPRGQCVEAVFNAHREQGGKHLVIERGFVHRDRYYMAGWGGLNGRADFCNRRMPADRWKQLDVEVAPWRKTGEHIVLCGQVPWDASVQHTDHIGWCRETAMQLRSLTSRPVIFRPHPMHNQVVPMDDTGVQISTSADLIDDLKNAWAVVTFNSNAGVEATIAGVPAFAFDPGAMGYSIMNQSLDAIEAPKMPKRRQWLNNLAYTQWNLDEIAAGLTWNHLWESQLPIGQRWQRRVKRYWSKVASRAA